MDRALVERARGGDHEAFSALAGASIGRLYGLARLVLHDEDAAQDAVQNALVQAWGNIRSLREPDAWDAWLHRLTIRACYELSGKHRRRAAVELQVAADAFSPGSMGFEQGFVERDAIGAALARLPIEHRAVLVTRFYLDLPIDEIAMVLDIPAGTAKSRLNRALNAMRGVLAADATGERLLEGPMR
jgi:RNA polymerase sigma-70 factor (ECF subfamily)